MHIEFFFLIDTCILATALGDTQSHANALRHSHADPEYHDIQTVEGPHTEDISCLDLHNHVLNSYLILFQNHYQINLQVFGCLPKLFQAMWDPEDVVLVPEITQVGLCS